MISWFENLGSLNFGPRQDIAVPMTYIGNEMTTNDIDSDGDIDIIVARLGVIISGTQEHTTAWLENLGGGNFSPAQAINKKALFEHQVELADLDNDGDLDVISYADNEDKITWTENYFNGGKRLEGKIFYDANQNGQFEASEIGLSGIKSTVQPNTLFSYGTTAGDYFHVVDSGTYNVGYVLPNNYWNLTQVLLHIQKL